MNNDYEYEIDLVDLIKYILKKWKIILACAIAFCLILAGYALLKTKTYYRAQVTMTVQTEVSGNPVEKLGVFNRSDVVQAALKDARSSTSVSEASKWISVSRTPYTNKISLTYSSTKDEAVSVLSSLARKSGETINAISGYKVLANSNRVTSLSSVKNGPSLKKYSVLGVLAGAFLCAFAHMLRYIFEDKVRNINFVENVLGYKVLAKFDGEKDDYANLCANLKYGFKDTKIISVSAFEKEGKNVAGKLAEALSQTGKRVLYVKENVSGEEPNVIDLNTILLSDKAVVKARSEVETVVYTCTEDLTVLLQTKGFSENIKKNSTDFDYVIVDTPVIGENVSTTVLDAESDGVILVIEKDNTKAKSALKARKEMALINANVIGVVYRD